MDLKLPLRYRQDKEIYQIEMSRGKRKCHNCQGTILKQTICMVRLSFDDKKTAMFPGGAHVKKNYCPECMTKFLAQEFDRMQKFLTMVCKARVELLAVDWTKQVSKIMKATDKK